MLEPTDVFLPASTYFPVTITSVCVEEGGDVDRHATIVHYKYYSVVEEGEDDNGEPNKVTKEFFSSFETPISGNVASVLVSEGDEVRDSKTPVARILEPCTHAVQYGGLCALCGASLDEEQDYSEFSNKDRAPIAMSHDTNGLKVSYNEAERIEKTTTERLLGERKLILVVDLDQTVIHAAVDPTIGEWMKDPTNPNYEAVKDVRYFSLEERIPNSPGSSGVTTTTCWYYVKVRPGLQEFLETMNKKYEMHVYTMATKAYARAIAKIIDPEAKYFGDRILSRDESGSLLQKSLKRLFPVSTSMVAIIDDRGDVWKWSPNLVKVIPYNFFVGIGDINSSFLPRRNGLLEPTRPDIKVKQADADDDNEKDTKEEADGDTESQSQSPIEQLVEIAGGEDNVELLEVQSTERSEAIEVQQTERPLAKLQRDLEQSEDEDEGESKDQEAEEPASGTNGNGDDNATVNGKDTKETSNSPHHKHILVDNDNELYNLQAVLTNVHEEYYKDFDKNKQQRPEPDTSIVIPRIRKQVFKGCVFLFSGVLPLGTNLDSADIVQWVRSFGAVVVADFVDTITHVIAASGGTKKVQQAAQNPHIKIVSTNWLFACISKWSRVPEDEFAVKVDPNAKFDLTRPDNQEMDEDDMDEEEFVSSLNADNMNWDDINKEVEDFMNSSDDEDDNDGDDDEDDEDDEDDNENDNDNGNGDANESTNGSLDKKRPLSEAPEEDPDSSTKRPKTDDNDYDEDELAKELEDDLL